MLVHDFAYADLGFDGYVPPSASCEVEGAKEVLGRALLHDQERSPWPGGAWPSSSAIAQVVAALTKLKSYLDYGTFQPVQIASTVTLERGPVVPSGGGQPADLPEPGVTRCAAGSIGWDGRWSGRKGTMFAWAPIPEPYAHLGSVEFASMLVQGGEGGGVARGSALARAGDGFVRFALIENEQRINQAIRHLRQALTKLG